MFQVADIYKDAKKIYGVCDEQTLFTAISDALQAIANKGTYDPYMGFVDLCVDGRYVTLPREVDVPMAVNIGGRPALGRDQLFSFHLNGPGDGSKGCPWAWDDKGYVCIYKDLVTPVKLCARLQRSSDAGRELIVYGFDEKNFPIRQNRGGSWQDGYLIPTIAGVPAPDADMPWFSRITRIHKAPSDGVIELRTVAGDILGAYEPDETDPWYRRIHLARPATWVRLAYRKTHPKITSLYERIPLRSRLGFVLMLKAVKCYSELDLANAHLFEADAARLETEAQEAADPPTMAPIQHVDLGNNIANRDDLDIA